MQYMNLSYRKLCQLAHTTRTRQQWMLEPSWLFARRCMWLVEEMFFSMYCSCWYQPLYSSGDHSCVMTNKITIIVSLLNAIELWPPSEWRAIRVGFPGDFLRYTLWPTYVLYKFIKCHFVQAIRLLCDWTGDHLPHRKDNNAIGVTP